MIKAKGLASLTDEQKKKRHDEQKKVPSQSARPCRVCSRPLLVHDCTRALSLQPLWECTRLQASARRRYGKVADAKLAARVESLGYRKPNAPGGCAPAVPTSGLAPPKPPSSRINAGIDPANTLDSPGRTRLGRLPVSAEKTALKEEEAALPGVPANAAKPHSALKETAARR